ncbi:flagellar hook assembly protein FlgD [Pseudodonghicola sp.]|uniref:flagellar hook assembly protein FlgD n=1 Tax=Pseudodonghicola sp. TaxID=1969463 RepID=UPI003A96CF6F
MTVTNTTGTSAATTTTGTGSLSSLAEDYTRFLTLLTAQIQNQDPLEPMDSTTFVSQLAQLSQVEQSVKTNSNLETLSSQFAALNAMSGAQMIGRDVTAYSSNVVLGGGETDSYYLLSGGAASVSVDIYDSLDRVIRTISDLPTDAGELHSIDWDGTDDDGGAVLDGSYTMVVNAKDSEGKTIDAYSFRKTTVDEVLFSNGQLYYNLTGDETVSSDAVVAIR